MHGEWFSGGDFHIPASASVACRRVFRGLRFGNTELPTSNTRTARMKSIRWVHFGLMLISVLWAAGASGAEKLSRRWFYLQMNLQVAENVPKVTAIMRRAADAGYNGLVLADYKLNILDRVPEHYFRNFAEVQELARELKLEIIPTVAAIGYSDGLLAHDVNLAEGIPVRDAPFVVRAGVATLESDLKDAIPGGDFEKFKEHAAQGWDYQDHPGIASFIDTHEKHAGTACLRFENLGANAAPSGNGRVVRTVPVQPWRQYHASVWIKSEDFSSAGSVRMFAMGAGERILSHSNLGVQTTQEWTQHHVVFNSLENSEIRLYCGAWGGAHGKLWLDDVALREVAFLNLVRRDGCPLVVTDAKGKPLKEGRDFEQLVDPKMGTIPYPGNYDVFHESPVIKIRSAAKIKEGQKLLVSYYHTVTVHDGQVTCCLANEKVFAVLRDQVARVEQLIHPQTWFLSHDEIRLANWCQSCRQEGRSAGKLLAENIRRCAEIVREVDPQAELCVWSDMFDPQHNAHDDYYLVQGDLAGSWEGLDAKISIVNWNSEKPQDSLAFFGNRGNSQILAGYYDGDPASIVGWLQAGMGIQGIDGAMYTTWQGNFDALEAFAKYAWGQ